MCLRKNQIFGTSLIVIFSCLCCFQQNKKSFVFIDSIIINSFPSSSAVEFHEQKLYVFGDDASYLLVLDTSFNILQKVFFDDSTKVRLVPGIKPDIESTSINKEDGKYYLYAFGSHSSGNRKKIIKFPLDSLHNFSIVEHSTSKQPLIKTLNIEGAAFINGELFLANRANNSFQKNHIFLEIKGEKNEISLLPQIMELKFPETGSVIGISGLFYLPEKDLLLVTATQEETPDPLLDGKIGDSFLGWISNFSKTRKNVIELDKMINLTKADSKFIGNKIESVTVQHYEGNNMRLVLVADNDDGKSILFKVVVDVSK